MLHLLHVCCAACHKSVHCPGAQDLESKVAHEFVKQDFKVLLHSVVGGSLQASRCLVLQSFNEPHSFVPGCVVYFGPYW